MFQVKLNDDVTIYEAFVSQIYNGWKVYFDNTEFENEIKDISETLSGLQKEQGKFYPKKMDIFNAFIYCPLDKLKVVIIGQDLYTGINDNGSCLERGIAFSTRREDPIQPNLLTIYHKIKEEYGDSFKMPSHGDLSYWCEQGVLLLNNSLTYPYEANQIKTKEKNINHTNIWKSFIDLLIENIRDKNRKVCFVLWGANVQKSFEKNIGKGKLFLGSHPSPRSAHLFYSNHYFKPINDYLYSIGDKTIDWNVY